MNWIPLEQAAQLEVISALSYQKPVVLFKHSTRCSISIMAKGRLDRATQPEGVDFYYLDLLAFRPLSNQIAEQFAVHHESPQLILLKNGACVYEAAHNGIDMDELLTQL
jgi:bacillithiol system protein YtxJ